MREIRRRIRSVKNTQQITRAMKMVAAARLRKAQERVLAARPYAHQMREMFANLLSNTKKLSGVPLFEKREVRSTAYIVITADRGLCGAYNANIMRKALYHAEERERVCREEAARRAAAAAQEREPRPIEQVELEEGGPVQERYCPEEGYRLFFIPVGRKGRDFLRFRGYDIPLEFVPIGDEPSYLLARELGREVMARFEAGEFDEVYLVYSQFISALSQRPTVMKLLPLEAPASEEEQKQRGGAVAAEAGEEDEARALLRKQQEDLEARRYIESEGHRWRLPEYIFEPSAQVVLGQLIPKFIETLIYQAILEGKAGEFGARMTAMDSATKNAGEMIDRLTLSYNRARQAGITKEIAEIVGGAEALK
ncbi:MAG: FoF1 ATP synthase subunit gamma [Bacillota bacterium]|nr:FoF1 ATP synthase subunit gamma [Bacillota bacterium]